MSETLYFHSRIVHIPVSTSGIYCLKIDTKMLIINIQQFCFSVTVTCNDKTIIKALFVYFFQIFVHVCFYILNCKVLICSSLLTVFYVSVLFKAQSRVKR